MSSQYPIPSFFFHLFNLESLPLPPPNPPFFKLFPVATVKSSGNQDIFWTALDMRRQWKPMRGFYIWFCSLSMFSWFICVVHGNTSFLCMRMPRCALHSTPKEYFSCVSGLLGVLLFGCGFLLLFCLRQGLTVAQAGFSLQVLVLEVHIYTSL